MAVYAGSCLLLGFCFGSVGAFMMHRPPSARVSELDVSTLPRFAQGSVDRVVRDWQYVQNRYIPQTGSDLRSKDEERSVKESHKSDEQWLTDTQRQREALPYAITMFLGSSVSVLFQAIEPLEVMLTVESLFFIYCAIIKENWLKHPVKLTEWPHDEFSKDWPKAWGSVLKSVPDAKSWFSSWFLGPDASFDKIALEDAHSFLSWAMFCTTHAALNEEQRFQVALAAEQIQTFTNSKFLPRRKGAEPLRSMRPTILPLRYVHKPLGFYLCTQGLFGLALSLELKNMGFTEHEFGDFRYFLFRSPSSSSKAPIFFWHGVGGLAAYLPLVKGLSAFGRDVIVVEMPYVSLHVAPNVPTIAAHTELFSQVMDRHFGEGKKAVLIGHSWGSNVVSWLVKSYGKERIASAAFLDPVCFMLHLDAITRSWFFSRDAQPPTPYSEEQLGAKAKKEPPLVSVASLVSLVKTELFVVNALQRPLVWFRNTLFAENLQDAGIPSLVVVSDKDHIVPHRAVFVHVTAHEKGCIDRGEKPLVHVESLADSDHGGLVFDESQRTRALQMLEGALLQSESSAPTKRPRVIV